MFRKLHEVITRSDNTGQGIHTDKSEVQAGLLKRPTYLSVRTSEPLRNGLWRSRVPG
jgi:hypothetical protein